MSRTVIIGSDHAGYNLKEDIKQYLSSYKVIDIGCDDSNRCDFNDYANTLSQQVLEHKNSFGIIICGTGVGVSIACNKYDNSIRCALCHNVYTAKQSRNHIDVNVLALGGRLLAPEYAKEIIFAFLNEPFYGGAPYNERVDKLSRRL